MAADVYELPNSSHFILFNAFLEHNAEEYLLNF